MHNATITELWIFPIKGCQGIQVDSIYVDKSGVKGDRDFAFWKDGKIIDQKCTPKLAAISASVNDTHTKLMLCSKDHRDFELTIDRNGNQLDSAQILDRYQSIDQGDAVAEWASAIAGKSVRLVIPGDSWTINLPVPSLKDMHKQDKKKFFAVSSVSLLNMASLDALNKKIEPSVGPDRFRSNIVVKGMDAWEEDTMGVIFTNDVKMNHMSGAERCVIITTDQKTGERPKNNMLQTLKDFRLRPREDRFASGLLFGDYMSVAKSGVLKVGDIFQHGEKTESVVSTSSGNKASSSAEHNRYSEKLAGAWEFIIYNTPQGDQRCNIDFIFNGTEIVGSVTGSELINAASEQEIVEIEDCELNDCALSFAIEIKEPFEIPMICNFEIHGERMSGTVTLGALGCYDAGASKL